MHYRPLLLAIKLLSLHALSQIVDVDYLLVVIINVGDRCAVVVAYVASDVPSVIVNFCDVLDKVSPGFYHIHCSIFAAVF